MRIHTTKDGAKIKLRDMTNSHLAATIRMMERKASEGITVRIGGGSCPDDFFYDEDRLKGKTALEHMGYVDYVKERDRRISNMLRPPGQVIRRRTKVRWADWLAGDRPESDNMTPDEIRLMRGASYLLPDPGGEVVRELLDEIERLQAELANTGNEAR